MPARSIAASAFAAKWSGRGGAGLSPRGALAALDYIAEHAADLGSDSDRRRSAGAVAAPAQGGHGSARRDRTRQSHPRAYARCRPWRRSSITPALVKALRTDKATFVVLHANHARELTEAARAACARLDRRRHPDAVAIGAAARRQRRCRDARRTDAGFGRMPDQALLPAPRRSGARHGAFSHHHRGRAGADARRCTAAFPDCASRLMCSIFRAATANRRSGRPIWTQNVSIQMAARSKTSPGGGIAYPPRQ